MAWQCISTEVNVKGFKKYFTSNAVSENFDNILCNGSEEDGNVRSECEEDEDTNCEDGDSDTDWQRYTECDMFCVIKCRKTTVKIFFPQIFIFWGGST